MTVQEFKNWSAVTAGSKYRWQVDFCQYHNNGGLLCYFGGIDGKYVEIDRTGEFSKGTYEGAIPHIGEAMFRQEFSKQFASFDDAVARLAGYGSPALAENVREFLELNAGRTAAEIVAEAQGVA